MMSITFLVCFCSLICCYNKQIGGAVYIWGGSGFGKFTRVYFKDNKATGSVSNLLLSFSATSTILEHRIFRSFISFMEMFFDIHSVYTTSLFLSLFVFDL